MIVKKMPILQGFPGFETVKKLTRNHVFSEHFAPLFYDIETTGLSRNSTFLYWSVPSPTKKITGRCISG